MSKQPSNGRNAGSTSESVGPQRRIGPGRYSTTSAGRITTPATIAGRSNCSNAQLEVRLRDPENEAAIAFAREAVETARQALA